MNNKVKTIRDVVDTACLVHQLDVPEQERNSISMMAWLESGGDYGRIVDSLAKQLEQFAPRRDDAGKPGDAPAPFKEANERITSRSVSS